MSLSPEVPISPPVETPETREALERWRQGKINIGDELARLETERNAARAAARKASAENWIGQLENANQQTIRAEQRAASLGKALDEARKERNAAREDADNLEDQRDLAMKTIKRLETELDAARATIRAVLEENRHLADGENCTLARLKTLVPDWK